HRRHAGGPRRAAGGAVGAAARPRAGGAARAAHGGHRRRAGHAAVRDRPRARPRRPRADLARAGAGAVTSVAKLLEGKRVCVCAGSGGVGKTTTSAAIAMGMAAEGLRVAVVTIDPAKRLANALG